jgi:hypothetical protein
MACGQGRDGSDRREHDTCTDRPVEGHGTTLDDSTMTTMSQGGQLSPEEMKTRSDRLSGGG